MTAPLPATPPAPVSLFALYRVFFVLGLLSFGGGVSAWMHREVVQVHGWMSDHEFISGFALGQILPGVNSANLAVYIGQHLRGPPGAAVALVGMLTGPFVVVILAAVAYHRLVGLPGFAAATAGVAAVAVGMLLRLGFTLAGRVPRRVAAYAVMLATFVAVGVLKWPLVPVVAVLAPISIIAAWPRSPKGRGHA
ncbi:MAG: chromate transporter [Rhizobiales bacterium]|nr:chromate transporter [Hyphomicrobiales bacterium]